LTSPDEHATYEAKGPRLGIGGASIRRLLRRLPARALGAAWSAALVLLAAVTIVLQSCREEEKRPLFEPSVPPPLLGGTDPGDRRLIPVPDGRVVLELHGEAARVRLRELMSRRPEAFANLQLPKQGYRPTDIVHVERIASFRSAGFLSTQTQQELTSEGEILFWSWDDGDDSTWEGVIYFEHYASGLAGTNEAQIDCSNEEQPLLWSQNV
jgi:hypothetical protein